MNLGIKESEIKAVEEETNLQVERATEIAKSSSVPEIDLIHKDLWSNGGSEWHN